MTTEFTQKFTPLTEEELTQVDGGTIAGGVTAVGTAIWGAFK